MAKDECGDEIEVRTPANDGQKSQLKHQIGRLRSIASRISTFHRARGLVASAEAAEDIVRHVDTTLKRCLEDID